MSFHSKLFGNQGINKNLKVRLRCFLLLFVLLLSIPMTILVERSYKEFQKEVFNKHRWLSQHIIKQIDERMKTRLQIEEERSFNDYQYFILSRTLQQNTSIVQLSPLAKFPDSSKMPGIVGYFQVDEAGNYNCPLLPYSDNDRLAKAGLKLNIKKSDLKKRKKVRATIRPLLIENGFLSNNARATKAVPIVSMDTDILGLRSISVDPLQSLLTDDGYLIFYRELWKGKDRIVQGFVVDQQAFLNKTLQDIIAEASFETNVLIQMRNDDNVLSSMRFSPNENGSGQVKLSANPEQAEPLLLHQQNLAAPLQNLGLHFSVTNLPMGPGARTGAVLLSVVIAIMLAGLISIYRLGIRQIRLNEERINFVSAVSHELKTPLTSIIMYAEMLREGMLQNEDKRKSYYDFIFFEGERLSRLIANVLRLSKLGQEKPDITLEYTPVSSALELIQEKTSILLENNGFELILSCEQGECENVELLIDQDAFTQVFINLVDNAVKFSKNLETVEKRVELKFECDKLNPELICFSVRDFGPGITKEHSQHIFDIFYRAGNELTRKTQGTGIGLALVNELTRAMGGQVMFNNANPGAEFSVCLQYRNV